MKLLLSTLIVLMVLVSGCSEDPGHAWFSRVAVLDVVTGEGLADVEFVLVDMRGNHLAGPPVKTDPFGSLAFDGLREGRYAWVVLPGQGWAMARPPAEAALYPTGSPPASFVDILELLSVQPGGDPRVTGQVVDAESGEPIVGATVGLPGWPHGWDGWLQPSSDVTDDEGRFLVRDVPFAVDPNGGDPFMLWPLIFQAEGYVPLARDFAPPGQNFDEVLVGSIGMLVSDPDDLGSIMGHVVFGDEPVPGVDVVVTWVGDQDKTWIGHPGLTAVTDDSGRFILDGLAPGVWGFEAAFFPEDGWVQPMSSRNLVTVRADEVVDVGIHGLQRSVRPIFPLPGAVRVDSLPVFRWHAVAEADSYDVFIGRWALGRTHGTELSVPEDSSLSEGTYSWQVRGVIVTGGTVTTVASSEVVQFFVVGPFEDPLD